MTIEAKKRGGMKMKRRLISLIPALALLIVVLIETSGVAEANNHSDTLFEFGFNASHQSGYASGSRSKTDDTSVYMLCNYAYEPNMSGPFRYNATAHGGYSPSGSFSDCYYNGHHSTTYTFYKDDEKYMSNYIYEANRHYAKIFVQKNGAAATFKGYWSPDSV